MNTHSDATVVLCYGDSNTWGQKPDKSGRFTAGERWPGRLQAALGDGYYIIEEGLSSRTTDLDYAKKPGRNGRAYLTPCIASHNPLDIVVVMLGTNDLKIEFNRSAQDIAHALEGLVADIKEYAVTRDGRPIKIVLVSPILIDNTAPHFAQLYDGVYYDSQSVEKSKALAAAIKQAAEKHACVFVDASTAGAPGEDGIHCDKEAHAGLARALEATIRGLN